MSKGRMRGMFQGEEWYYKNGKDMVAP